MKLKGASLFTFLYFASWLIPSPTMADVEPLIGLSLFGGAERGAAGKKVKENANCFNNGINDFEAAGCHSSRTLADSIAFGGFDLLGVLPVARQFGLQGNFGFIGEHDGYRLSTGFGPIYDYNSGKVGLFFDYQYRREPLADIRPGLAFLRNRQHQHFMFLDAAWAHYFDKFDLVFTYSHPLVWTQQSSAVGWDPRRRVANQAKPRACFAQDVYTINELKGVARIYPIPQLEVDIGMLVNSFAGPHRNTTGTGVGGVFGLHYGITKNIVLNIVQAQGDSRERFRTTSGVQFFWSPASDQKQKREEVKVAHAETMLLAGGGGTHGNCL